MSDLFHEDVPDEFIVNVYAAMVAASWHTFQVLTKRPERRRYLLNAPSFREWVAERAAKLINALRGDRSLPATENLAAWNAGSARNIHEGVSVEDQQTADERIPILLQTPAAVRFVSAEPLLGPVQLGCGGELFDYGVGRNQDNEPRIHWVIAGGESGPGARPCDVAWIRSIVQQCQAAAVPCFVKQLGTRPFDGYDRWPIRYGDTTIDIGEEKRWMELKDKKGGDPAEWPKDLRVREWPR
jgi:protein gp37